MDAGIKILQLGVGKKCLMNNVKHLVMFGDRVEKIKKSSGDSDFDPFVGILEHFSYKVLIMECGQIAEDDIQWDFKRYKKKFACKEVKWGPLKLHPFKYTSLVHKKPCSLPTKFVDPFQELAKIETTACKQKLPQNAETCNLLLDSLLKQKKGDG